MPQSTALPRIDRAHVRAMVAAIGVGDLGVLPAFLTGAMSVQIGAELGFGAAGLGVAVGAFFLTGAASSMALGGRVQHAGAARAQRLGAAGGSLALLALALGARSLVSLVAILAAAGLVNAWCQPAANLGLSAVIPPGRQGLAFAVKQSGIPLSILLGGLAVPTIALSIGWRWAYVILAVVGAIVWFVVPPDEDATPPPPAAEGGPVPRAEPDSGRSALLVVAGAMIFGAASANTLGAFFVRGAVDLGTAEGAAGLLVAVGAALTITTRLAAGHRVDRTGTVSLRLAARFLTIGAVGFLAMTTGVPGLFLAGAAVCFSFGWGWPGLYNHTVVAANPSAPAAATGIAQVGTYFGAFVGPLLFGVVVETIGWSAAWAMSGAAALVAATLFVVVDPRMRAPDPLA